MTPANEPTTTPFVTSLRNVPAILAFDLYRFVHKGIRAEMFAVTVEAGSTDPADRAARRALGSRVQRLGRLVDSHCEREDLHCQPVIERVAPDLAAGIVDVHPRLATLTAELVERAGQLDQASDAEARAVVHALYLELASFAGTCLEHLDYEERVVLPKLAAALPFEELAAIEIGAVSTIPNDELSEFVAVMLPAMNIEDRVELLGGMRASTSPEAFARTRALAQSVLTDAAWTATAARLGLA